MPMSSEKTAEKVLHLLHEVCGTADQPIGLHEPTFNELQCERVLATLRSGWVSTAGNETLEFEKKLASFLSLEDVVAVNSGTSALHLALLALGIKPGDGVALPALGFIASANAVSYVGADPHFIDVDPDFGLLDVDLLKEYLDGPEGAGVRAVIYVCLFGQKADPQPLLKLAKERNLIIIEDAAGALGSQFNGKAVGSDFDATVFSFNGNKIITTGAGGALAFRDPIHTNKARHLSNVAKTVSGVHATHNAIGYNYRMPAINASIGISQLSNFNSYIEAKKNLNERYQLTAKKLGLRMLPTPDGCCSNEWLNNIVLDELNDSQIELRHLSEVIESCHKKKFMVRPLWQPLHQTPMYQRNKHSNLVVSESLARRVISLPSSPSL